MAAMALLLHPPPLWALGGPATPEATPAPTPLSCDACMDRGDGVREHVRVWHRLPGRLCKLPTAYTPNTHTCNTHAFLGYRNRPGAALHQA